MLARALRRAALGAPLGIVCSDILERGGGARVQRIAPQRLSKEPAGTVAEAPRSKLALLAVSVVGGVASAGCCGAGAAGQLMAPALADFTSDCAGAWG